MWFSRLSGLCHLPARHAAMPLRSSSPVNTATAGTHHLSSEPHPCSQATWVRLPVSTAPWDLGRFLNQPMAGASLMAIEEPCLWDLPREIYV